MVEYTEPQAQGSSDVNEGLSFLNAADVFKVAEPITYEYRSCDSLSASPIGSDSIEIFYESISSKFSSVRLSTSQC